MHSENESFQYTLKAVTIIILEHAYRFKASDYRKNNPMKLTDLLCTVLACSLKYCDRETYFLADEKNLLKIVEVANPFDLALHETVTNSSNEQLRRN